MVVSNAQLLSLGLNEDGIRFVEEVRAAPARRVSATRYINVVHRFPSIKMGVTIQAESRTSELPYVRLCELDPDVAEYYDQPQVSIHRTTATGRPHLARITLDYLIIRSDGVFTVECKPRKKLELLLAKKPTEWTRDDDGTIHQILVEKEVAKLGIRHVVWDADSLTKTHKDNLFILVYAARRAVPEQQQRLLADIQAALKSRPLSIAALCRSWPDVLPVTVLTWIAKGQLSALLDQQSVSELNSTLVFSSDFSRAIAMELQSRHEVPAWSDNAAEVIRFTDVQIAKAQKHLNEIDSARREGRALTPYQRKLQSRIRKLEAQGLSRLHAAVPRWDLRGNRTRRFSSDHILLFQKGITTHYINGKKLSKSAAWRQSKLDMEAHGISVSRRTWTKELKRINNEFIALGREGHRAAAAARPPSNTRESIGIPWLHAHADSTTLDQKIFKDTLIGEILDRPTLYKLVDQANGDVLAAVLHFGSPCRDFVALLLRDCVRRWKRLPLRITFDGGSEYDSTYTEKTLARLDLEKGERPRGAAKYGGPVESSLGRLDCLVTHTLSGNTQNDRSRATTDDVRAHRHAIHELVTIQDLVDEALFKGLNHIPAEHSVFSPDQLTREGLSLFGGLSPEREFDLSFLIDTAIEAPKQMTLKYSDGIQYKHRRYSAPGLADPKLDGTKVTIRHEPFCPSVLYVGVGNRWIVAKSADHELMMGLPEGQRWAHYVLFDQTGRAARARKEDATIDLVRLVRKHETAALAVRTEKTKKPAKQTADATTAAFKKAIALYKTQQHYD